MRDFYIGDYHFKLIVPGLVVAFLIAFMPVSAEAARGDGHGWITAQSQFDFRTISAPVRSGPNGDQVRLPGGTWINCEYTCAYTLRSSTLDFFECGEGGPDDCSPGILDEVIARRLR